MVRLAIWADWSLGLAAEQGAVIGIVWVSALIMFKLGQSNEARCHRSGLDRRDRWKWPSPGFQQIPECQRSAFGGKAA